MDSVFLKQCVVTFILSFLLLGISIQQASAESLTSEGGRIVFTFPFPCVTPFFGFWTVKLTNTSGGLETINVIYPYLPPLVTKAFFFPAIIGATTLGTTVSDGSCVAYVPCVTGSCPITLNGMLSIMHGIAFQ